MQKGDVERRSGCKPGMLAPSIQPTHSVPKANFFVFVEFCVGSQYFCIQWFMWANYSTHKSCEPLIQSHGVRSFPSMREQTYCAYSVFMVFPKRPFLSSRRFTSWSVSGFLWTDSSELAPKKTKPRKHNLTQPYTSILSPLQDILDLT